MPFAVAAVYTWWFAARKQDSMSDRELIHSLVHTQPGKSLYGLCNLVLYAFIVPVSIGQTFYHNLRRKFCRTTTYKLGPLSPEAFDDLMDIIGKHHGDKVTWKV
jgi:hypothetical protein